MQLVLFVQSITPFKLHLVLLCRQPRQTTIDVITPFVSWSYCAVSHGRQQSTSLHRSSLGLIVPSATADNNRRHYTIRLLVLLRRQPRQTTIDVITPFVSWSYCAVSHGRQQSTSLHHSSLGLIVPSATADNNRRHYTNRLLVLLCRQPRQTTIDVITPFVSWSYCAVSHGRQQSTSLHHSSLGLIVPSATADNNRRHYTVRLLVLLCRQPRQTTIDVITPFVSWSYCAVSHGRQQSTSLHQSSLGLIVPSATADNNRRHYTNRLLVLLCRQPRQTTIDVITPFVSWSYCAVSHGRQQSTSLHHSSLGLIAPSATADNNRRHYTNRLLVLLCRQPRQTTIDVITPIVSWSYCAVSHGIQQSTSLHQSSLGLIQPRQTTMPSVHGRQQSTSLHHSSLGLIVPSATADNNRRHYTIRLLVLLSPSATADNNRRHDTIRLLV